MAFIHTIKVVSEKRTGTMVSATRTSEGRKYLACVVVTTTEASIRIAEEKKASTQAELAKAKKAQAELAAALGLTVEEALAQAKVAQERWYGPGGWFDTSQEIRKERNLGYTHISEFEHDIMARMLKNGFVYPYGTEGIGGVSTLQEQIRRCEGSLDYNKIPVLGSQGVLSWHGSVQLAQKAMAGYDHWQAKGDTLEIRTDITIVEKTPKKRAPKA